MTHRRIKAVLVAGIAVAATLAASQSGQASHETLPPPGSAGPAVHTVPAAGAGDEVLLAAGDIAVCGTTNDEATADLLDTLPGTIATLGDNVYESGTTTEFDDCYDPSWGRHKARTNPSAGNHEYNTPGATGYYGYFGTAAGDPTKGYYSYDLGAWHIIVLNSNSNCVSIACGTGSAQEQWLRADLAANPASCTLAYWHHPRFSSGSTHGNNANMQAFWQALYDYRAEVVLNGHVHNYERFAPQTPTGAPDPTFGIREFVVGTGGRSPLYGFAAPQPNSVVRDATSYGVLELTLGATGYDWEFKSAIGSLADSGSGVCNAGNAYDADYDGDADTADNCIGVANPAQSNADANFIEFGPAKAFDDLTLAMSDAYGDGCDLDDDNDGLSDADEIAGLSGCEIVNVGFVDPLLRDTDGDLVLDGAECAMPGRDPGTFDPVPPTLAACGGPTNIDGDALRDDLEFCYYGTSTASPNSDGDLCDDGKEVASINADTQVNSLDLSQVAQHFSPSSYGMGAGAHVIDFDVNKDVKINSLDLAFVAQRFGVCGGGGSWQALPPLPAGPRQETGVAALNGEVYVLGGFNASSAIVPLVEAYDVTAGTWRTPAPLPVAMHHANVAEINGKLYVTGFLTGGGFAADGRVYEYDPGGNAWTSKTSMPAGTQRGASGVAVVGGKIYVAGGYRAGTAVADFSVYDPALDSWQTLPNVPTARDHLGAAAINGMIYAVGGRNGTILGHTATVHRFDPASGLWSPVAPMLTSRGGHAVSVAGDRFYAIGGEGSGAGSGVFNNVEAFDQSTGHWAALTVMLTPRHGTGAATVNGIVYVPGGATVQGFGAVATTESFAPPP